MFKWFISINLILILCIAQLAQAEGVFNPNLIIQDSDINDYQSMNATDIQRFLESKKSFLATYLTVDNQGNALKASQAIYNVAQSSKVNPKFIIVLLQKEQSLIEETNPSQRSLDWATGYGCPDGSACNVRWQGFWKQINSASLQFRDYIDNPHLYTYRKGQTYQFKNNYSTIKQETTTVTPANDSTAALYNYTPHVYNGNYNFWKIWNRYFQGSGYPSGTLVRAKGELGIWMIERGARRPFLTRGAFSSRFDFGKVLDINKSELERYPIGPAIKFPQYSIVKSPAGRLYLLVDDKRRPFINIEAFNKIGYNPDEVINATWEDISIYTESTPITIEEAYPVGALLQDSKSGAVFWINEGKKLPITDPLILTNRFKSKKPQGVSSELLAKYPTAEPLLFANGELVKLERGIAIYVTEGRTLRPIKSMQTFNALGYKLDNVININLNLFKQYQIGESIQ